MIIREPTESDSEFCRTHGIGLLPGDARDAETLRAAAVGCARRLIATTGDDVTNLQITMTASDILGELPPHTQDLRAFAAIDDRSLWRELSRSDAVAKRRLNFELRIFSPSELVARRFFWDVPLYRYADLRDQPRIHAVFLGVGHFGEALMLQIPRACGYRHMDKLAVTIMCRDAAAEVERLRRHCPEIDAVIDLEAYEVDVTAGSIDESLLREIEARSPVTSVFICLDSDKATLQASIYAREIMQRSGCWKAPLYPRIGGDPRFGNLLTTRRDARRFDDVVRIFGTAADNCDLDLVDGGLEKTARKIHDAYRATRRGRLAGKTAAEREESLQRWEELKETYRESNRRAADHIKAKLESAGCHVPTGLGLVAPTGFKIARDSTVLEALAALEHRSWCSGMKLDGWRPAAKRNNRRREHDNLVEYKALDESSKAYDRNQIDLIDTALIERKSIGPDVPAIRHDHWIGLIGRNRVAVEETEWAGEALTTQVLERLVANHEGSHFTLVTPLAPGFDLVMTRTALDWFAKREVAHRLLVVEAVPSAAMVDDYREAFEAGSAWNGAQREANEHWTDTTSPASAGRARIVAARQEVLQSPACEWLIDLTEPDADYSEEHDRQTGYRRAGDYIAARSHTLVAATLHNAEVRLGGIMDTLARRSTALASRYASWPAGTSCATVLLVTDTREVRVSQSKMD
jgi:hypothetical protein